MAKKTTKGGGALIQKTKERALARNKARLAELLALIRRRVTEVVEGFYDIGEALREILDHKLYAALGHASLAALLHVEKLMSLRQANKLIAVARKVPREQALALGPERAYALVTYTDATPEADSPAQLVAKGAKVGGKRAGEASVRNILEAARDTRAKVKAKRPKTEAERTAAKAEKSLEKALREILREAGIERAEITIEVSEVRITVPRATVEKITGGTARGAPKNKRIKRETSVISRKSG